MRVRWNVATLGVAAGLTGILAAAYSPSVVSAEDKAPPAQKAKPPRARATAPAPPAHAPDRLIVRFKSEGDYRVAPSAHRLLPREGGPIPDDLKKYAPLIELHRRCGATRIRGLFYDRQQLETAEAKGVQDRLVEQMKAKYPARSRRAPGTELPDLTNYYVVEFQKGADLEANRRRYMASPFVKSVEYDTVVGAHHVPNDPFFSSKGSWGQSFDDLWGLKVIQAEKAWDATMGQGIVVAVVDTGLDYNHPDIAANAWSNPGEVAGNGKDDDGNGFVDDVRGWDFVHNDNDPMDDADVGHGTHVSGTIAAVGDNGVGIIGVAPKARILPVKGRRPTARPTSR